MCIPSDEFNSQGRRELSKGTVTGDTWTWNSTQNYGGQEIKQKMTIKILTPASYTMKFEVSIDGTNWMTFMEGKGDEEVASSPLRVGASEGAWEPAGNGTKACTTVEERRFQRREKRHKLSGLLAPVNRFSPAASTTTGAGSPHRIAALEAPLFHGRACLLSGSL